MVLVTGGDRKGENEGEVLLRKRPQPAFGTGSIGVSDQGVGLGLMGDGGRIHDGGNTSIFGSSIPTEAPKCLRVFDIGDVDEVNLLRPVLGDLFFFCDPNTRACCGGLDQAKIRTALDWPSWSRFRCGQAQRSHDGHKVYGEEHNEREEGLAQDIMERKTRTDKRSL